MERAFTLKEAVPGLDPAPALSAAGVRALERLARDSLVPVGAALAAHAPAGLNLPVEVEVRALSGDEGLPPVLTGGRWVGQERVEATLLASLRAAGRVEERARLAGPERETLIAGEVDPKALTGKQLQVLEALRGTPDSVSAAALARAAGVSTDVVTRLVGKGVIRRVTRPRREPPSLKRPAPAAVEGAGWPEPAPVRLGGASRGERLARLAAWIAHARNQDRGALVICPDLATFDRAWEALAGIGAQPYTSAMPPAERLWVEDRIRAGEVHLVIGTPAAWLLPVPRLGLVAALADGAEGAPRAPYGALNHTQVALALAAEAGATAVVEGALHRPETVFAGGSAVHLPGHAPRFRTDHAPGRDPLSNTLRHTLLQVRDRERQAVLIAGRRGYSAALVCPACGWRGECPRCDLRLRYHRAERRLICHRCGHEEDAPAACPRCGGAAVEPRGTGTQWVATSVRRLLGEFPVLRWDRDRRDDLGALLAGDPGVIVATRAIARLPALPALSLIALVDPDTALAIPDYRSPERVLRAALEALDLAPGGRRPLVVAQTAFPGDAVWKAYAQADTEGWLNDELGRREAAGLPPHRKLVRLEVSGRKLAAVEEAAQRLAEAVRSRLPGVDVHGPAPAPVARMRDRHLRQVLVAGPAAWSGEELVRLAAPAAAGVRIAIEVDPRDLSAPDRPDVQGPLPIPGR
jgi:primosomal protein N' (replication factor Y)